MGKPHWTASPIQQAQILRLMFHQQGQSDRRRFSSEVSYEKGSFGVVLEGFFVKNLEKTSPKCNFSFRE